MAAALRPLIEAAKREIRSDVTKALRNGAASFADMANQVLEGHRARIERLEQRAASQAALNKQRKN